MIGNFVNIIKGWIKPATDNQKAVTDKLAEHDRAFAKQSDRLDGIEAGTNVLMKTTLALVNHEITGNGVEKLKEARDSIQNYLIDR